MTTYIDVSRKTVGEDRIAICPNFGCEFMTRVKPLKFGFLSFGKHPKCKKHHLPLVYIDERIGDFVDSALACFFDKAGLPPNELLVSIKLNFSNELETFVKGWVYSITVGRGAPIVSRYMDTISNAYLKQLTKKQLKALKRENEFKPSKVFNAIKNGLNEIIRQYTRILKHLRVHFEIFSEQECLKSLSKKLRNYLNEWQKNVLKNMEIINSSENKREITLKEIKQNYDQILNVGTCRCLIGLNLESKEIKKAKVTAFDRFSAYHEFYLEGLTVKFTKSDIINLLKTKSNNQKRVHEKLELLEHNEENGEFFNIDTEEIVKDNLRDQDLEHSKDLGKNNMVELENRLYLSKEIERDIGDSIWALSKTKDIIINSVIKENLDLNDELNYALFKMITGLMQEFEEIRPFPLHRIGIIDSKGRKFISFQDPDFQGFKKMFFEGKPLFAGIIYSIECIFPRVDNNIYVGLTIKDADKRFEEHVLNSMRSYLLTNGDMEQPGYGKLQNMIIQSLLSKFDIENIYNQIKLYSNTYRFEKRRIFLSEIINYLKKSFKINILEFHYGVDLLDEREKYYIENYPYKGKIINTVKNGLNMNVGSGGPGKSLPIYDIAILIALGQSIKKIIHILKRKYNLEKITRNVLVARIDNYFGGWYQAQESFLKPIIEALVKEGLDRNAIYLHFKDLEVGSGWFRDWSVGDITLEYDIQKFKKSTNLDIEQYPELLDKHINQLERYYCGISEKQWLLYIRNGIPIRSWRPDQTSISSLTKIGERKINTILNILFRKFRVSNKHELRYLLQKINIIKALKRGYISLFTKEEPFKKIKIGLKKENFYYVLCKDVFNLSIGKFDKINECRKHFEENLFKGKSVGDIFEEYYLKS